MVVLLALVWLTLAGCTVTPEQARQRTDDYAYGVIDAMWDEKFGLKPDYRLEENPREQARQLVEEAVQDGVLTLPEAAAIAMVKNSAYQLEKETLYLRALDLRMAAYLYDPVPFSFGQAGYWRGEDDNDQAELAAGHAGLGFEKIFATGARLSAQVAAGWAEALAGDIDSGMSLILDAAITQPLLRGAGRDIAMEPLTQAQRDVLYQIRTFNRFRKTFMVDAIQRYYRVLEARRQVAILQEDYETTRRIYQQARQLAEDGRLAEHEVGEINQARLNALEAYVQMQKLHEQALDEFKVFLTLDPQLKFTLDGDEFARLQTWNVEQLQFDEDAAVAAAKAQRLDLANAADAVIDAERKVKVAADLLRPELNLTASVQRSHKTIGVLDEGEKDIFVGSTFDFGLDRTEEENQYRQAEIVLRQAERALDDMAYQVTLQVRTAYRNLREANQRYRIRQSMVSNARERLDNTLLLLQYGRANGRDVLRAKEDLFEAQAAAATAMVDFNAALMDFYRDIDILQVRPDGLWQVPDEQTSSPADSQDPVQ